MTAPLPAILGGDPAFPERLPLVRPTLDDVPALARRIEVILGSGALTNGTTVRELEASVCSRLGVAHTVAVSSCTAGLMLTYQSLRVGPGHRVVLPSFTFAASAHAVTWVGATPEFCEVTDERCSAEVDDIAGLLEHGEAPIRAVSATHVYGHPAEVEALDALAASRGIPVVYDAAHALGSRRGDRPVGSFGTAEVFSLSPTKVVTAGEGGLVTTNDGALADDLRLGRDYGNPGDYDCRFPGLNARMSELHAAVALASLEGLDRHVARRQELVERFAAAISEVAGLRIVRPAAADRSTWKDLTLVVQADDFGVDAATLQAALTAEQIDSRRYYHPPIHRQQAHHHHPSARRDLPVTDRLSSAVLTPPLWSHLADQQLDRLADAVRRIHAHAGEIAHLPLGA